MSENTIEIRQNKSKEALIEQLKKTPIIQIACEKAGVGRATFYRWKKDDKVFAEAIDCALDDGSQLVSDMAESKLISAIKNDNLTAVMFWLKNHHTKYANRLEVNANVHQDQQLTSEQQAIVEQALRLANLANVNEENGYGNSTKLPSSAVIGTDIQGQENPDNHNKTESSNVL